MTLQIMAPVHVPGWYKNHQVLQRYRTSLSVIKFCSQHQQHCGHFQEAPWRRLQDLDEISKRIAHAYTPMWKNPSSHMVTLNNFSWEVTYKRMSNTKHCKLLHYNILFPENKNKNSINKQPNPHIWHPHFRMLQPWVNKLDFRQMQCQILKSHRKCFIWLFVGFGSGSNPN